MTAQSDGNAAKAREYETKAARWLVEANEAKDLGKHELAEKLYAKCQFWFDKMNVALGKG